ncbi:MAG: hypothetical protein ACXV3D_02750 [Halobacteriota archaeon]
MRVMTTDETRYRALSREGDVYEIDDSNPAVERRNIAPDSETAYCPLCERSVCPKREYGAPLFLGVTSLFGIVVAGWYSTSLVSSDRYSGFAGATLGALLEFAVAMFAVILVGSIGYLLYIETRKKRCPICNARL